MSVVFQLIFLLKIVAAENRLIEHSSIPSVPAGCNRKFKYFSRAGVVDFFWLLVI